MVNRTAAGTLPAIAYGMLSRTPSDRSPDALGACARAPAKDMLACAFATWLAEISAPDASAIVFDCDGVAASNTSVPEGWVQPGAILRTTCLRGGVCLAALGAKGSKRCHPGTAALLSFLFASYGESHDLFLKVDSDTLVSPRRIHAWVAGLGPFPAGMPLYAGNTLRTPNFQFCNKPTARPIMQQANRTCVRSTDDWLALEDAMEEAMEDEGLEAASTRRAHRQMARRVCTSVHPRPQQPHNLDVSQVYPEHGVNSPLPSQPSKQPSQQPPFQQHPSQQHPSQHHPSQQASSSQITQTPSVTELGLPIGFDIASACAPIEYARGGAYLLSLSVLTRIVKHDCVRRVARIRCTGWDHVGGCEWSPEHEDVAVGLCARLAGAKQVLNSLCFNTLGYNWPSHSLCNRMHVLTSHPIKLPGLLLKFYPGLYPSANTSRAHLRFNEVVGPNFTLQACSGARCGDMMGWSVETSAGGRFLVPAGPGRHGRLL